MIFFHREQPAGERREETWAKAFPEKRTEISVGCAGCAHYSAGQKISVHEARIVRFGRNKVVSRSYASSLCQIRSGVFLYPVPKPNSNWGKE